MKPNSLLGNSTVLMFVSLSNLSPDRYGKVFKCFRKLTDIVTDSVPDMPALERWEQATSEQPLQDTALVTTGTDVEIKTGVYELTVNVPDMSLNNGLMYYARLRSPEEAERGAASASSMLRIELPQKMIRSLDVERFMQAFIVECADMDADYACVDLALLSQTSMEQAPFRMFRTTNEKNNGKLPGIHWGQYISRRKYADIEKAVLAAAETQDICKTVVDKYYIWIQLVEKLGEPSVKTRSLFWKAFANALPEIDFDKVKAYRVPIFKEVLPYWIPADKA